MLGGLAGRCLALAALVASGCGWFAGPQATARPRTSPSVPAATSPTATPTPGLHVSGGSLVDGAGHTVRLLGVNRSGTEYACIQGWGIFDGPSDAASVQAIRSWNTNTVRVPLNEDCWLDVNLPSGDPYGGDAYKNAIARYVSLLNSYGLYVILDLHADAPGSIQAGAAHDGQLAPMPDADHAPTFWAQVAGAYKDNLNVIFDLHNEAFPEHDSSPPADPWACWLHGCTFTGDTNWGGSVTWAAAGMQSLVDAIRGTGARNVIMAGGLSWANDESGWLAHEPADPTGNLVASWHSYPDNSCNTRGCWDSVILPLSRRVPVITGETGDHITSPATYQPVLLPYLDRHGISYLGWTWDDWRGYEANVLITDYRGTPTPNFGAYFRRHLAALAAG